MTTLDRTQRINPIPKADSTILKKEMHQKIGKNFNKASKESCQKKIQKFSHPSELQGIFQEKKFGQKQKVGKIWIPYLCKSMMNPNYGDGKEVLAMIWT